MLWWEKNRIYNYQLASFYSDYISEELDVIKKDKLFIKRELSVYEQQIILSVGRFIQEKGFDVLIERMLEFILLEEIFLWNIGMR